jgi:amino acid adenylation domain-containing protein
MMLTQAGCRALIVDTAAKEQLSEVLRGIDAPLLVLLPDCSDVTELARQLPQHTILAANNLVLEEPFTHSVPQEDAIAYLLFTSGSTGVPKGVMVSHRNVTRFLRVMQERYSLNETDRLSQMFDMVFDLSVFDMFMAWEVGACVCVPSRQQVLLPADYIVESDLTVWFSVPSVAVLMKQLRFLQPEAFPHLRLSLFCGEALMAEVAHAWQMAAPNSVVENLYGPTEVTLACTVYRWQGQASQPDCENGVVPIGEPFPGMTAIVVNEALKEVLPGQSGELLMAGPQVALGYWKNPEKTSQMFLRPPGRGAMFYRTGDLVRRPEGTHPLNYLGRIDHQIKIRGLRVELGEIEAVLREAAGIDRAVALGWPIAANGAEGIVAFLETKNVDITTVLDTVKARLPTYMVPRAIHLIAEFPLNANGKIDREALQKLLEK